MDLVFFGVSYIMENIPRKTEEAIRAEAKKLRDEAGEKFIQFLNDKGLEDVMGLIRKKQ